VQPQLQQRSATPLQAAAGAHTHLLQELYVTSATGYLFRAYDLPLQSQSQPALTVTGVDEPVPIAEDGHKLYVGSYNDGTIHTYDLPLRSHVTQAAAPMAPAARARYVPPFNSRSANDPAKQRAVSAGFDAGVGNVSGLAISRGYLYAVGSGPEVQQYKLPLVSGERPSGSIAVSTFDFVALAARDRVLYVASTTLGTISGYRLPLTSGESPEFTISTPPQTNAAIGIAVEGTCGCSASHLYVTQYSNGTVLEYALPYHKGEAPARINVRADGGTFPYGIAVGNDHLFVTASGSIFAYRLPVIRGQKPDAINAFEQENATDLAVSPTCY
jgi:hypothetical protein